MAKHTNTPQELERACLAGFIKWPNCIADYLGLIKTTHFDNKVHAAIFSATTSLYQESGNVDPILIAEKLTSIGLKHFEDLNILDYLDSLSRMSIKQDLVKQYMLNVIKYDYARRAEEAIDDCKKEIVSNIDKSLPELAGIVEKALKKAETENVAGENKPIDVFSVMPSKIMEWVNNPQQFFLKVPWPVFSHLYGGLSFGDLAIIAAPPKIGKSTMVNFIAYSVAGHKENNCRVLILDTELETDRIIARNLSALSGVNEFKIKHGLWVKNPIEKNKVHAALNTLEKYQGRVHHEYVANRSIDEVISIAKRWYVQNIKEGENCLIVYDYLKSTQDNISNAFESYELLGMKTDKLKKLVSELPRTAGLTAVQINRTGGTAMSSQIEWHCSNMYRLEKKSVEEIAEGGKEFGTHKLVEVLARVQGEGALGADNYVKRATKDGDEYVQNYINFKIDSFNVLECGSAADVFGKTMGQAKLRHNKDGFINPDLL